MVDLTPKLLNLFIDNNCWEKYYLFFYNKKINRNFKSAIQIFNEIKNYYYDYKINKFEFLEPINIDISELNEFCSLVIKNKLDIEWNASIVIDQGMNGKTFNNMRSAGCEKLIFNIIGASDSLLKKLGLNFTTADVSNILRSSCNAGIQTSMNLLLGYPSETNQEFKDTIEFLKRNIAFIGEIRLDYCISNYLTRHFFPEKMSLCAYWQRCYMPEKNRDSISPLNIDEQIIKIKALGMPIIQEGGLRLFNEVISNYILPYSINSHSFSLFADLRAKSLRLFFQEKELTKERGLHSCFLLEDTWFDTSSADWQVEKEEDTLILKLFWKTVNLTQTWRFSFRDNVLLWQVSSQEKTRLRLKAFKFGILLQSEYKTFFCAHQQEDFPLEYTHWQDLALEEPKARFFGVRKQQALPAVFLEREDKQALSCIIQNSDIASCCRVLQLGLSEEELFSQAGFDLSTKLTLLEDETSIDEYLRQERQGFYASHTIYSDRKNLIVSFNENAWHLFWRSLKLTQGFGLYTSIFAYDFWHDSKHATWEVAKINEQKMVLKGEWQTLPIIQVWNLELKKDTTITWKIEMEVLEDIVIEGEQQTNLMLSNEYGTWLSRDGSYGVFPNLFNEEWITLFEKEADVIKSVSVKSSDSRLPSIRLKCSNLGNDFFLSILNTSSSFCARKLKCYKIEKANKRYLPGEYPYFAGEIEIIP